MLDSVPYGVETSGHEMVAERLPGSRLLQPAVVCVVFLFFFWLYTAGQRASEMFEFYRLSEAEPYSFGCYSRLIGEAGCWWLRAAYNEDQLDVALLFLKRVHGGTRRWVT